MRNKTLWMKFKQGIKYNYFCLMKSIDRTPFQNKVDIGGANSYHKGWRTIDYKSRWYQYPDMLIDYNIDLNKMEKLPFKDNSIEIFFTSHTLEHFDSDTVMKILKECYRCLKPNGLIRIVVPHCERAYNEYGKDNKKYFKGWNRKLSIHQSFLTFFHNTTSGIPDTTDEQIINDYGSLSMTELFDKYTKGRKEDINNAGTHINWFTPQKLGLFLSKAGFNRITISGYCKSSKEELRAKGWRKCFDKYPEYSLFMEAFRGFDWGID